MIFEYNQRVFNGLRNYSEKQRRHLSVHFKEKCLHEGEICFPAGLRCRTGHTLE